MLSTENALKATPATGVEELKTFMFYVNTTLTQNELTRIQNHLLHLRTDVELPSSFHFPHLIVEFPSRDNRSALN